MNRPEIPFNKRTALAVPKDLFRDKRLTEEIRKELNSPHSKELLTEKYINYILSQIDVGGGQSRALRLFSIKAVSGILDKLFKSSITSSLLKERIDMNVVAFRTYIICRMHRILTQDAADFEKILSA